MAKLLSLKYQKRAAQQAEQSQASLQMQMQMQQGMDQVKLQLEQVRGENARSVAEVTGKYDLLGIQMKEQNDLNKKMIQEVNKLNISREKQEHDISLTAHEFNKDSQLIGIQREADIAVEKAKPTKPK